MSVRASGGRTLRDITNASAVLSAAGGRSLSKTDYPQNDAVVEEMQQIPYWAAVAALVWVATMTQPHLSYAAHQLAKFSENPGPTHWQAARKVLQYLWRMKDWELLSEEEPEAMSICPDTRRPVSGGAVTMGEGTISWFSRVQKVTAAASLESDYVLLSEMVNEHSFLR